MINKIILVGRVGITPEARYTQSGKLVTSFSLATQDFNKNTHWHKIIVWEKQAEFCC
jgi:single-strand DNA-binding protein